MGRDYKEEAEGIGGRHKGSRENGARKEGRTEEKMGIATKQTVS